MSGDRSVALKGGFWTSLSTAVALFATFIKLMILTRFLEKSEFGVVSIVNMVIGLCTTITDLGFTSVIMYKQKLTEKEFSSLFWIQLFVFIIIYLLLLAISPPISKFYGEPVLSVLIPIASLSIIFQAIGNLYDSVLQKRYYFRQLAFRNIVTNLVSFFAAGWMAWKGWGIYSLVISTLLQYLILNTWNFIKGFKLQRIVFLMDFRAVTPLMKIGLYQTGTRILDYVSTKLDVMLIGKLLGTETLGIYDLSKELVYKLIDFIRSVVSKVALPILSNNNKDENSVKSRFLLITKAVAFLCIPICTTVAVFSKIIVTILYGQAYIDAAPLVSIFAIITMFTSISSFFDMLGLAKGRTDLNFKNTVYRIIMCTPVLSITCFISVTAVAWGQLFVTIATIIVIWNVVVKNTYPIDIKTYFSQFDKLLFLMAILGIIVSVLMYYEIFSFLTNIIVETIIYALIYCSLLIAGAIFFLKKDIELFLNLLKINRNKRIS